MSQLRGRSRDRLLAADRQPKKELAELRSSWRDLNRPPNLDFYEELAWSNFSVTLTGPVRAGWCHSELISARGECYLHWAEQLPHLGMSISNSAQRGGQMATLNLGGLAFDELGASGLARPAAEKFAGAWVACLLVMARGNIFAAFSFEHLVLATVCGTVGAVVTVALLVQMGPLTASAVRQRSVRS